MRKSIPTSARSGIFSRVRVSFVRSDAIISGSAAFLAPEILMTPLSFWPPTIRIRSNKSPCSKKHSRVFVWWHRSCDATAFCGPALHGQALRCFVLSRGRSCPFRAVSLLRLAAAEVSPQRFGEALAAGGFALASGAGHNPLLAGRGGPVSTAGQSRNFLTNFFASSRACGENCPHQRTDINLGRRRGGQGKAPGKTFAMRQSDLFLKIFPRELLQKGSICPAQFPIIDIAQRPKPSSRQ